MNVPITSRKLAVISAGLLLAATASFANAQQLWAEQVMDQREQEQQIAKERKGDETEPTIMKQADSPKVTTPNAIDLENLNDDQGNSLI